MRIPCATEDSGPAGNCDDGGQRLDLADSEIRQQIHAAAWRMFHSSIDSPLDSRPRLEEQARRLLQELELGERYLGLARVCLGNASQLQNVIAVPFSQRLLIIAESRNTLKAAPASGRSDSVALDQVCQQALLLGYTVHRLDATDDTKSASISLKAILQQQIGAIVGIAPLELLDDAFENVLRTGLPAWGIPLWSEVPHGLCVDQNWLDEVLERYEPGAGQNSTGYLSLIQTARELFEDEPFAKLLPPLRAWNGAEIDPLARTESIAREWLIHGGKRFRPFITLAAWAARAGVVTTGAAVDSFPEAVLKAAVAIEAFHKASLVHDDIQDDDQYRYGCPTLHLTHGVGMAINVGDYLIGLGYRLLAECHQAADPSAVGEIVQRMSIAHIQLCEGQGAEMEWTSAPSLDLSVEVARQIYALKTSPAFEAALYSGLRLAGDMSQLQSGISEFCRHLGIGFQILNDLKDWQGDVHNKVITGQDAAALRPTLLLALAIERADSAQRDVLAEILSGRFNNGVERFRLLKQIFEEVEVFTRAEQMVDEARRSAETLIATIEPPGLRQFLAYLIDTVLAPEDDASGEHPEVAPCLDSCLVSDKAGG